MNKKNDKRLCWNCEGNVSQHLSHCPYCGQDVTNPQNREESQIFKGFNSPFQRAETNAIPQPPYARSQPNEVMVTQEEWNAAINEEKGSKEEDASPTTKREMIALLLLLPGIVFFLFGLALIFFSSDGVLTLCWNQDVAYFYFLGAAPLLFLGWRAFNRG